MKMEEKSKFIQKSEVLKALAHPTRLCIEISYQVINDDIRKIIKILFP
jgi:hypothetical protein